MAWVIQLLSNPQTMAAILGILGSLAGWAIKKWMANQQKKADIELRQKAEQTLADALAKNFADETTQANAAISKEDHAAEQWLKPDPSPKP